MWFVLRGVDYLTAKDDDELLHWASSGRISPETMVRNELWKMPVPAGQIPLLAAVWKSPTPDSVGSPKIANPETTPDKLSPVDHPGARRAKLLGIAGVMFFFLA